MPKTRLEEALIQLRQGDDSALTPIYELTQKAVFATAFAILKDEQLAQDVMQDTYLKVRSAILSYQVGTTPQAWIVTIARNFALMEYRRRKKEMMIDPMEHESMFGSEELNYHEMTPYLKEAIQSLPDEQREVVMMHIIGEMKHREISEVMHKPLGTILWMYRESLKKLKNYIESKGGGNNHEEKGLKKGTPR